MAAHDVAYDSDLAHARAREWARRQRPGRLQDDEEIRTVVQAKPEQEWSPEQISAWLRAEHPDRPAWHVCHETIYRAIYDRRSGGLSRWLSVRCGPGACCASGDVGPSNAHRASLDPDG
jgi:transposase, IS30 family